MLDAMKQAVQFGLRTRFISRRPAGMEPLEGLPLEARIGISVLDGYWISPACPCLEFVEATIKRSGRFRPPEPVRLCLDLDLRARRRQGQFAEALDMAKALQDFQLPPYRAGPNSVFMARSRPADRLAVRRRMPPR